MRIGNQIKLLRERMLLSQKELAKKLGISQSYLSGIESGKKLVNANVVLKLLTNLNLRLPWLFEDRFRISGILPEEDKMNPTAEEFFSFLESGDFVFFEMNLSNMRPFFENGDILIIIDRDDRELRSEQIFLFEINGRKEIKLAFQMNDGSFKLTNINPHPKNNDILPNSSTICLGRVVYAIRKI